MSSNDAVTFAVEQLDAEGLDHMEHLDCGFTVRSCRHCADEAREAAASSSSERP